MANQNPDNNFTQLINSNAFDIMNTESHLNTSGSIAESMTTNSEVSLATQLASPPKTQLYPIDEEMTKLKQRISNLSRQINIACQVCEQVDTKKDKTGKIIVDHGRRFNSKTKESKNERRAEADQLFQKIYKNEEFVTFEVCIKIYCMFHEALSIDSAELDLVNFGSLSAYDYRIEEFIRYFGAELLESKTPKNLRFGTYNILTKVCPKKYLSYKLAEGNQQKHTRDQCSSFIKCYEIRELLRVPANKEMTHPDLMKQLNGLNTFDNQWVEGILHLNGKGAVIDILNRAMYGIETNWLKVDDKERASELMKHFVKY